MSIRKKQNKLKTAFCGLELENPFILASGPPTRNARMILAGFEAGWAGAVTKTISLSPTRNPHPRLALANKHNLINIELISTDSVKQWSKWNGIIKKEAPDKILITSIMASNRTRDWQELTAQMNDSGADALELNVSCPHGMPEKGMGSLIGQNASLTGKIVAAVKKKSKIPVIVKLTPNVTDISLIARSCQEHGADALSGINTVKTLAGIDIETRQPLLNVKNKTAYGGYSGKAVKPIALRCVSEMYQATKLPISGGGGISDWEDSLEFILVGASSLQVCTAVMLSGYSIIKELTTGLRAYLDKHHIKKISSLTGAASNSIVNHSALPVTSPIASIRQNKCLRSKGINCRKCFIACRDSGFQAIITKKKNYAVSADLCDACGLCICVCPVNAIILR